MRKVALEAIMKLLVKSLGFSAGEALRQHVARRVQTSLTRWTGRIARVVVRFVDTNGPRGGGDKTCFICLDAPGRAPVVVGAVTSDYYSAADLAFHRLDRAVSRLFGRRPT
jgi:putative sigma-54 modulation protein